MYIFHNTTALYFVMTAVVGIEITNNVTAWRKTLAWEPTNDKPSFSLILLAATKHIKEECASWIEYRDKTVLIFNKTSFLSPCHQPIALDLENCRWHQLHKTKLVDVLFER